MTGSDVRAVYVISVAAELAGMHPQTLRIYERRGLVEPARTSGGNRRYSEADVQRLHRIHGLVEDGMNLAGVAKVLELEAKLASLQKEVLELRARVRHQEATRERSLLPLQQAVALFGQIPPYLEQKDSWP
jgi:MerR family transcriptional regulator, heat shock protein HspR